MAVVIASRDPHLGEVRKQALEQAGYRVLTAFNHCKLVELCRAEKPQLVVIGYSIPGAEKRLLAWEVQQHCRANILELYRTEWPALNPSSHLHQHYCETPTDFVGAVRSILRESAQT